MLNDSRDDIPFPNDMDDYGIFPAYESSTKEKAPAEEQELSSNYDIHLSRELSHVNDYDGNRGNQGRLVAATVPQMQSEEPQPLMAEISDPAPYPIDALGPLKAVVQAVHKNTQAPIAIPAASALAAVALAVQGYADVETLAGYRPISLFILTIAASGERKSACDSCFTEGIKAHEGKEYAAYNAEYEQQKLALDIWLQQRNEAIKNKQDKTTASNALGPRPKLPKKPDRFVTEPTFEGLVKLLDEGQPSLALLSAEGGQFLGGHAMNKDNRQKTITAFNSIWDGDDIRRTRAGEGSMLLPGRRVSLHLMIQPGVANDFLADPMVADTGFLGRCLISFPESTIGKRLSHLRKIDERPIIAFTARLKEILVKLLPIDPETGGLKPRKLSLSEEAKALLVKFYDYVEREQASGGSYEHITGSASKIVEQTCRLAGVLTLWDNIDAVEISAGVIVHAIEIAQYHLTEMARLTSRSFVSEEIKQAERLRLWLLKDFPKAVVCPSEILQRAPTRNLRIKSNAEKSIDMLVKAGWLIKLPENTLVGGRSRKVAYNIWGKNNDV